MYLHRVEIPAEFKEFIDNLPKSKTCGCATSSKSRDTVYTVLEKVYRVNIEPLQDRQENLKNIIPTEVNVVATFTSSAAASNMAEDLNQEQDWNNASAIAKIESIFGTRNVTFSIDEMTYTMILTIRLHTVHGNDFHNEASELN